MTFLDDGWPCAGGDPEEVTGPHLETCPGCGNTLVWADALIFGCSGCSMQFFETEVRETFFRPAEGL